MLVIPTDNAVKATEYTAVAHPLSTQHSVIAVFKRIIIQIKRLHPAFGIFAAYQVEDVITVEHELDITIFCPHAAPQ